MPRELRGTGKAVQVLECMPDEQGRRAMYLRQALGEGTIGDVSFELSSVLGSGSLYVCFDRKRQFLLDSKAFVEAAFDALQAGEEEPNRG